jgi:ElaB/YqjD/DUF883 family membrane-anchored ribosome-binding protein
MSPHVLVAVALLGPSSELVPVAQVAPAPWVADDLRQLFSATMSRPIREAPAEVAADLLVLYAALHEPSELSGAEVVNLRGRVRQRLEQARERLRSDRHRLAELAARDARRRLTQRTAAGTFTAGVTTLPGELASAQGLIDLITETIDPESWDVNGGRGRIRYYAPLRVLVVRNTLRVHEQLGGALGDLQP